MFSPIFGLAVCWSSNTLALAHNKTTPNGVVFVQIDKLLGKWARTLTAEHYNDGGMGVKSPAAAVSLLW